MFTVKGFDFKRVVLPVVDGKVAVDWSSAVSLIEQTRGVEVLPDVGLLYMLRVMFVVKRVLEGIEANTKVGDRGIVMGDVMRVAHVYGKSAGVWGSCFANRGLIVSMWHRLQCRASGLCGGMEMLEVLKYEIDEWDVVR